MEIYEKTKKIAREAYEKLIGISNKKETAVKENGNIIIQKEEYEKRRQLLEAQILSSLKGRPINLEMKIIEIQPFWSDGINISYNGAINKFSSYLD